MKLISLAVVILALSSTASAVKRDFLVKVTEYQCDGEGHSVVITYDTSKDIVRPSTFVVDNKDVSNVFETSYRGVYVTFKTPGFKMVLDSNRDKKSFNKSVIIRGKDVLLKCSRKETYKFFQPREDEVIEVPRGTATSGSSPKRSQ